jgi:hypothetical protein
MSKSEHTDKPSGQSAPQHPTPQWTRGAGGPAGGGVLRTAASSGARPIKVAGRAASPAGGRSKGQPAKRFVEPFQYDEVQRRAILEALAEAGLDDDTREIFVGAIAYDLALLQAAAGETALAERQRSEREPATQDQAARVDATKGGADTAGPLAETARSLAAQLEGLSAGQRDALADALRRSDPFDRAHDDAYLRALLGEIRRIAEAAADIAQPASMRVSTAAVAAPEQSSTGSTTKPPATRSSQRPAPDQQTKPPSEAAIAFIRHAAKVYEQCFEARPSSKSSDPFARVLKVIAKATGVPVPSQTRVLKQALSHHQQA